MDNPKISIIIVVYNAKEALRATLNNVVSQKYYNKEIIVIDGDSTDGTKDVIIENSMHISKWISEKDNGIYDAMNKGIANSTGDYVWFINAGDYIYSSYTLENIIKGNDMDFDIYYGDTLIIDENGEIKGLRKKNLPKHLNWLHLRNGMVVCHQSIIVRRSLAEQYDTKYKYSADYKWMLEVLRHSTSIRNTGEIISVFCEGGATTIHRGESLKERYEIMVKYFGKLKTIISHIRFALQLFTPKHRSFKGIWDENPFQNKKNSN